MSPEEQVKISKDAGDRARQSEAHLPVSWKVFSRIWPVHREGVALMLSGRSMLRVLECRNIDALMRTMIRTSELGRHDGALPPRHWWMRRHG